MSPESPLIRILAVDEHAPLRKGIAGPVTAKHRNRRALIALGIILAWCPCASALNPSLDTSQYAHTAWTVREGFFKGVINAVVQTPDGYLWLGTEFGLLRFDGVRCVPWPPLPGGEPLRSSNIQNLLVARDGRLWIGTMDGLASWKDGKLTQYPELAGQYVLALLEDHEGTVWAGTSATPTGRLCAIQRDSVQCYGRDGSLGRQVVSLFEDRRGNLWAGAATGLWRWKPGPPKLYPLSKPAPEIHALNEGHNGALLISIRRGIIEVVDGKAEAFPVPGAGTQFNPFGLLWDRDGGLWIGTRDRGLLHMHQGRTDSFAQSDGLSGDHINSLFEDREGNIWVATVNGLDRFRDFAAATISVRQGLSNADVGSVLAARDGSVWIGTRDGLNRWKDGQITVVHKRNRRSLTVAARHGVQVIADSGLPDDYVGSLQEDARGRIWVFSPGGVAYFEDGRFIPVSAIPGGYIHSVAEDRTGGLWVSYDESLLHWYQGSVVERIPWAGLGRKDKAWALAADPVQGGLWVGFWLGGVTYLKGGLVRASYTTADGLGKGRVNSLHTDRDGTLWAATQGGLSRVKDGRVASLTSRNGLPCDAVDGVVEDDAHGFWLNMACGLVRIARPELDAWAADPERTIHVTVFDSSNGVMSHAFTSGSCPRFTTSRDGKLWFLPLDGVSFVDPHHLPLNKLPPPVHIEQIKADRKIYDISRGVRLPPLARDVKIDYTALSFVAPEKVHFRYRLEGQDPDWREVVNEREAQYSNLPPRHYRFRVMACNNSGIWNEAGDSLDFSVDPAYYQTTWFRVLCAAAFLALLWGLYRYRLHQIAREFSAQLEARTEERTRIARELHDTLLQSFQALMFHFQAVSDLLPAGEGKEALGKVLDRADQAIIEGRDAIHNIRSSTTVTNELPQAITALGKELACAKDGEKDSVTFRVSVEGPPRALHPIPRDDIYRIAREALRNAFRHAQASQIEAEITYGQDLLRLRIRDDGKGIDPKHLHAGRDGHWGLPGMRERAQQIGAQLEIWSEAGAGTEMELRVPGSIAYEKVPGHRRLRLFRKTKEVSNEH